MPYVQNVICPKCNLSQLGESAGEALAEQTAVAKALAAKQAGAAKMLAAKELELVKAQALAAQVLRFVSLSPTPCTPICHTPISPISHRKFFFSPEMLFFCKSEASSAAAAQLEEAAAGASRSLLAAVDPAVAGAKAQVKAQVDELAKGEVAQSVLTSTEPVLRRFDQLGSVLAPMIQQLGSQLGSTSQDLVQLAQVAADSEEAKAALAAVDALGDQFVAAAKKGDGELARLATDKLRAVPATVGEGVSAFSVPPYPPPPAPPNPNPNPNPKPNPHPHPPTPPPTPHSSHSYHPFPFYVHTPIGLWFFFLSLFLLQLSALTPYFVSHSTLPVFKSWTYGKSGGATFRARQNK